MGIRNNEYNFNGYTLGKLLRELATNIQMKNAL